MTPASRRLATLLATAVVVAGGCGHRHRRDPAHANDVVFWHSLPSATVDSLVREFEKANPDVHVTAVAVTGPVRAMSLK